MAEAYDNLRVAVSIHGDKVDHPHRLQVDFAADSPDCFAEKIGTAVEAANRLGFLHESVDEVRVVATVTPADSEAA